MLSIKTKVFLTVCALVWMVGGAIAASPVNAKFTPSPNTEPTSGASGSR